jgi:hypothetical protein
MAITPTWITLKPMGKGDNKPRTTRELTAVQLAALTKEAATHDEPVIALGRTKTLDDPFTTGLLAEVARRSQTQEFDEELLQEIQQSLETNERKSG